MQTERAGSPYFAGKLGIRDFVDWVIEQQRNEEEMSRKSTDYPNYPRN
jgi:hypothetical protein